MSDRIPKYFSDGDILWVSLSPTKGHEEHGRRPVLVVSVGDLEKLTGVIWVVPITTTDKKRMSVKIDDQKLGVHGQILVGQIKSIDPSKRDVQFIGRCPKPILEEVHHDIHLVLRND